MNTAKSKITGFVLFARRFSVRLLSFPSGFLGCLEMGGMFRLAPLRFLLLLQVQKPNLGHGELFLAPDIWHGVARTGLTVRFELTPMCVCLDVPRAWFDLPVDGFVAFKGRGACVAYIRLRRLLERFIEFIPADALVLRLRPGFLTTDEQRMRILGVVGVLQEMRMQDLRTVAFQLVDGQAHGSFGIGPTPVSDRCRKRAITDQHP